MIVNQNSGHFGFPVPGCPGPNPLAMVLQMLLSMLDGMQGGGAGCGWPMSPQADFGGQGRCGHQAMGDHLGAFLGGPFPSGQGAQGAFAAAGFAAFGQGAFGGQDVKQSEGNPKDWYFQHGKYETTKTDTGHIQTDGKTRVEYNKESKTGYVYGMVAGQWQLQEVRSNWEGKAASPVMLDMDGNNRPDVKDGEWKPHAERGDTGAAKARFDLDGDGSKELTEWTGGKDGLLLKLGDQQVKDYQDKGQLEVSGKELYGDEGGQYADGYEKMRRLSDADGDGKLSGEELDNHYVWQDADRDAVVDKGELKSTKDAGITSVKATHDGDYQSEFEMNGEKRKSWDWWPTTWA